MGLPGDKLQMKDGVLYINGTAVGLMDDGEFEEEMERQGPQGNFPRLKTTLSGRRICKKSRQIETLPVELLTLSSISATSRAITGLSCPRGHFFFMGTTATIPPTAACHRPWAAWDMYRLKT